MGKGYYISKQGKQNELVYLDYDKISGFDIKPKASDKYGIRVNKMIIVKPSMIEKLLIRKTKAKLDAFLKRIVLLLESDDNDDDTYREALNDMTRYKNIVNYKYRKYLSEKYVDILNKKVAIIEQELKKKRIISNSQNLLKHQMYQNMYNDIYNNYEEEKTTHRSR